MKKYKSLLSRSASKRLAEIGKQILLGFKIGIMKAQADEVKRKFEPYKLPCGSWVQSFVPFDENTIKDIKRWYDIDYE